MLTVKKPIIRSGGSSLVVLPSEIMDKWGKPDDIEMELSDDKIIIKPHKNSAEVPYSLKRVKKW